MRSDVQLPKEGLLNAFRHGKATTVSIRIISQGDPTPTEFVSMEVQDNEVGLSSEFVKGLGLTVSDCLNPSTCDLLPATRGGCHLLVEFP